MCPRSLVGLGTNVQLTSQSIMGINNHTDSTRRKDVALIEINLLIKYMYLLNAFSLQMIDIPSEVRFEEVPQLPEGLTSAIGHQDTANVLGVEMNRVNVHLDSGDVAYIAQLQGGRLPEGTTVLPKGYTFKFIKVSVI